MTSENKHLGWNYNIQEYKNSKDLFCENGLFSILFLACGRPDITRRCLLSTVDATARSKQLIEWILIENGECEENFALFNSLQLDRKVIIKQSNYGINEAWNQMWAISRGEFCVKLENDFENRATVFDFLSVAKDIFDAKSEVGIIQLRSIFDPNENWGVYKEQYNPWSCPNDELVKARVWEAKTINGHPYLIGDRFFGFNNNPTIIRKTLYRECGPYPEAACGADPRHGESLYQERILKTDCAIAHIGKEVYYHCGQKTTPTI